MGTDSALSGGDVDRPEGQETGTVVRTFLIADVRGYTSFTQSHGDEEAGRLAARFAELSREAVAATGGELIELRGDEALCVYPSARQALRGAVELQRRFRTRVEGEPAFPLGIGIGLAAGEAVPIEGGYRGGALNLAARLCSIARPGQVLASETVTSLSGALEGLRFVERRAVRMKGMDKPVRVIEILPVSELPPVPTAPQSGTRHRRLGALALGAVVVAAALAATAFAVMRGSGETGTVGNAIAAVDGDAVTYTQVGKTPSTIAVGEGAVWVLNADDRTISKIDQETGGVDTFGTGGTGTDLAVGEGAVWVGNGAAETGGPIGVVSTTSVSRVDPGTTTATRTVDLPNPVHTPNEIRSGEHRVLGVSQLAAGAGAIWAINPNLSVSRLDPATGRRVATIPVEAGSAIAAGEAGVWVLVADSPHVVRIDPRRNRVGQTIELGASGLTGLAVGAGSVWATDLESGLLWRIEPGPDPTTRTIEVGFGVTAVAYGGGAVWVTNFVRDEIVRVDPRTNEVAERIPLGGTPPSVAADDETAWVSVAGAPRGETLSASVCGPVLSGPERPDVLIASDLPLQAGDILRVTVNAIHHVLRQRNFRAGSHAVGYQSCDDSTAQRGVADFIKCATNAKAYAATARVVGVIGPWNSQCALAQIPIANAAEGPLAMISPSNTHPGLTRFAPGGFADDHEPKSYYPTGVRNYARVIAPEDSHAAAGAVLAKELGVRRLFMVQSPDTVSDPFATQFKRTARELGLTIAGTARWDSEAKTYRALADRVARGRPNGIFFPDLYVDDSDAVVEALRDRLGDDVVLITNDFGYAAPGMYVTTTGRANESLGPAGKRFLREFAATQPGGKVPFTPYVTEAAQAAEALLEAIERSDGTRASVTEELLRIQIDDGILGSFRFDANGDMTPGSITVLRVTGKQGDVADGGRWGGAVFDRVVEVPPELVRP